MAETMTVALADFSFSSESVKHSILIYETMSNLKSFCRYKFHMSAKNIFILQMAGVFILQNQLILMIYLVPKDKIIS